MSTAPKPPPPSVPLSDEEEAARDRDAAAAQLSIAWQDALDWAKRGDRRSLVAMLRGEYSLDDVDVRAFLADVLEEKERRPRGKPARRPMHTFFVDAKGRVSWIDKRDGQHFTIKKWLQENKKAHRGHSALLEAAAKHFKLDPEVIENIARRSSKARPDPAPK
ncbi:hypothetical protein IVB45_20715 [Bradyrhizobium sp. 4]|uniref:hypothetical protein n=1 Tax=unclassified Bradyrhizobium TaxID=2631580 RepID=UPI001FFAC3AA|nr:MULTISPECIES: hypothetical protein [unclassified Bradyrhizobium]MCK1402324.1 hypothetical protein [Bradyrhizobium sp. 39]MCK1747919.1 hypothetical protein [Bradyrhizobium sp. 135]UPJ32413.1 hypothetical protein IVB45_20715 [Bradyrhizobium sp. 4]